MHQVCILQLKVNNLKYVENTSLNYSVLSNYLQTIFRFYDDLHLSMLYLHVYSRKYFLFQFHPTLLTTVFVDGPHFNFYKFYSYLKLDLTVTNSVSIQLIVTLPSHTKKEKQKQAYRVKKQRHFSRSRSVSRRNVSRRRRSVSKHRKSFAG